MVPIVMPHVCLDYVTTAFGSYFERVSPRIDILVSISNNTEKDFLERYGKQLKPELKKVVIRHGDDLKHDNPLKPRNLSIDREDFILCVGTIEARKNHYLLYQTYRLAHMQGIDLPKLVIVGREGWLAEPAIYALKNDPAIKDKIVFAGPISDNELSWLYANCLFTVFPSLYEGWGLPVAESLAFGKVCAASATSSIPEIGGSLNRYFSPYDPAACLKILEGLLDKNERQEAEATIADKYKLTYWHDTAEQLSKSL
jgi:glycosyltransferase involved in cell wall biosynthesis